MYNKNIFSKISISKNENIEEFSNDYKEFISVAKTERLTIIQIEEIIKKFGFKNIKEITKLKIGDKIYFINKNKNIVLYKIGKDKLQNGLNILGAHLDSPRLDLKPYPFYESNNFAMLDTQYYGSIKKYQYTTIPLAMHGVIIKNNETISVNIGDDSDDPIFCISDLLTHLSNDSSRKNGDDIIDGENLDIIIGSHPLSASETNPVLNYILKLLNEKYNIDEQDFISGEIEIVPAGKARDCGLDRSMICAYGQDDRACVFAAIHAICETNDILRTSCVLLVDKEEVGNYGNTSIDSVFFENTLLELLHLDSCDSLYNLRQCYNNSYMINCDVVDALDPIYTQSTDNNCSKFNYGIALQKYSGVGGKHYANDANPEFFSLIKNVFDQNKIHYQATTFAGVDKGGCSTISYIMARYNMEVIDAGIPILNMHAPLEIISKADLYETFLAYKFFLEMH